MKNLAKAVIAVMKEVKGMEKNSRVGSGNYAYDGTKDQDVKEVFNNALAKHGLCIMPTGIEEDTKVDRWEDNGRVKQSIFTTVKTSYLLLHDSGESIELAGYGHGIDNQDKGAGKATTYALKNCLLYTFLTPVGKMADTDTQHSNEMPVALPKLLPSDKENWTKVIQALKNGYTIPQIESKWAISKENKDKLMNEAI